jgi:hypothetical protein
MDDTIIKCSGCRKDFIFKDYKTCDVCRERTKNKPKKDIIKCKKDNCKFKKSDDNDYCGKHQTDYFKEQTINEGFKTCHNYIRGCREKLTLDYKYSRCQKCLEKDRIGENNRKQQKIINKNVCHSCLKECDDDDFIGHNEQRTLTCQKCRDYQKQFDEIRDKEKTNERRRITEKNPERIKVKKEWKYNNQDKIAQYWVNARNRKINNLGIDDYHKIQADNAKKWRENNKEKLSKIYKNEYLNVNKYYNVYKNDSFKKNLTFELTRDEFNEIVKSKCYYCGIIQEKGFNGIDKKNCFNGYTVDNCVSCCEICNVMKGSLDSNVFIKRIEHILANHNCIDGEINYELFCDGNSGSYNEYKHRAIYKINVEFEITNNEFNEIINKNCYICEKENSQTHTNGIDRIDNNKGYTIDNVECCCGECNYMKNSYNLNDFLNKCCMIYENTKDYDCIVDETCNNKHMLKHLNKKSKEELDEINKNKRKLADEKLIESYKPENHKIRIDKILEIRKQKENKLLEIKDIGVDDEITNYVNNNDIKEDNTKINDYINKINENINNRKEKHNDINKDKSQKKQEDEQLKNYKECEDIKVIQDNSDEDTDIKKKKNKINQRNHANKIKENFGEDEYRKKEAERKRKYRERKKKENETYNKNYVNRVKEQIGEEEYRKLETERKRKYREKKKLENQKDNLDIIKDKDVLNEINDKDDLNEINDDNVKLNVSDALREKHRISKQIYREKIKQELIKKGEYVVKVKKTDEEIKENNRLRQQKFRDKKKQELNK